MRTNEQIATAVLRGTSPSDFSLKTVTAWAHMVAMGAAASAREDERQIVLREIQKEQNKQRRRR